MNPRRPPRTHYLRGNARESSPHRLLVVDTESRWQSEAGRELHTLRLWSALLIRRHDSEPKRPRRESFDGHSAGELADLVAASVRHDATTWLYTHNLSFDLGLTRLPLRLVERGFILGEHNLASDAPWARLKKGSHRLRLADSFSWLPVSVDKLGEALGLGKPALPDLDAAESLWLARCQADTEITATALCRLMDEWDRRQLGYWSLTGPGTGWNALRHMIGRQPGGRQSPITHSPPGASSRARHAVVVIDPDPIARGLEREALYSGRRDLWRVGRLPPGPYVELDLKTAHLAICAHFPLPLRRQASFERLELDDWRLSNRHESVLAQVVVATETPRYPLRVKGAVLHPVGSFQTTLAGPEVADAMRRGELLSVGRGYAYFVGPYMQPWARWALDVLDPNGGRADSLFQIMVKGWSRTVPGRWGMLHSRQLASGPSHVPDWSLEAAAIGKPPRRGFIFHFAGSWSENVLDQEADDSFPAVLAHIQSWCRVLLNRAIEAVDRHDLVSCNTEGIWMHERALAELAAWEYGPGYQDLNPSQIRQLAETGLGKAVAPLQMRVKQTAQHLRLLSPQHHEVDGATHYAGIPRSAEPVGLDAFRFLTWPKLKGQMERGDPRGYVRELRRADLSGIPVSRWAYTDGCCEPVRASWCPEDSGTSLLAPGPRCAAHGARLKTVQHPALRGLI